MVKLPRRLVPPFSLFLTVKVKMSPRADHHFWETSFSIIFCSRRIFLQGEKVMNMKPEKPCIRANNRNRTLKRNNFTCKLYLWEITWFETVHPGDIQNASNCASWNSYRSWRWNLKKWQQWSGSVNKTLPTSTQLYSHNRANKIDIIWLWKIVIHTFWKSLNVNIAFTLSAFSVNELESRDNAL